MRKLIQLLIFIIAIQKSIYAQNKRTLNLSGRIESIELIDSTKFNPYGFWRAFAYEEYEEDCNKPKLKDTEFALDFNKYSLGSITHFSRERVIGFGDTPIRSPIYNPKYVLNKENLKKMACREGEESLLKTDGDFFRRFDKLYGLHIGCFNMADSFDENDPSDLYILNNNLLMSTRTMNVVVYYERILNEEVYCGYRKNNEGYNVVREEYICDFLEFEYPKYSNNAFMEIILEGSWELNKFTLKNENGYFCEDKTQQWKGAEVLIEKGKIIKKGVIIKDKTIQIPLNILTTKQLKYSIENRGVDYKKSPSNAIKFKIIDPLKQTKQRTIKVDRTSISSMLPFKDSNAYLVKNDSVKILEDVQNWYRIEFQGTKKTIGWIRKSDVEMN
ncbi:hypothetical protein [Emticicia sp. SJ17W-69]|uniref:hypothetical protein n=1 Tax=Emticicia sp. SJ17W-69 TaxID=3421657 RepID=UPI003EBE2907